jgi:hypothetical protein
LTVRFRRRLAALFFGLPRHTSTTALYVWMEGGPENSLEDIGDEVVRTMVRASARVP